MMTLNILCGYEILFVTVNVIMSREHLKLYETSTTTNDAIRAPGSNKQPLDKYTLQLLAFFLILQ